MTASFPLTSKVNTYNSRSVGLLVKLVKEEVEHDGVHSDPPYKGFRVIAVDEKKLERMHHNGNELHLKLKNISSIIIY